MTLDLSDGKSIPQAYKEYYVSSLIAMQKWRRDLIGHWRTYGLPNSFKMIDGKEYWGFEFSVHHLLEHPEMVRFADLIGMDDTGKQEISNISGADWAVAHFRINPKTDNPYSVDNVAFVIEHGLKPLLISRGVNEFRYVSIDQIVPIQWVRKVSTLTVVVSVDVSESPSTEILNTTEVTKYTDPVTFTITETTINRVGDGVTLTVTTTVKVTSQAIDISYSSTYLPTETSTHTDVVTTGTAPNTTTTTTTTITSTYKDDPSNHIPDPLNMIGMDKNGLSFSPNFSKTNTDVYMESSGVSTLLYAIYAITGWFTLGHSTSVVFEGYSVDGLGRENGYIYRTHDVFDVGDYSWINNTNVTTILYPAITIGSSTFDDYFWVEEHEGMRIRDHVYDFSHCKNLAALIMDYVDYDSTGNNALSIAIQSRQSPYTWAVAEGDNLWFDLEYVMAMDIRDFSKLMAKHLNIRAGASSGFWGTFVGGFVGAVVGLFSAVLDIFFKVVDALDIVIKPTINMLLKYVFKVNDSDRHKIMNAYTEIRNQIALIVVTIGIGAYFKAGAAAAEATAAGATAAEVATISAYDAFAFEIMNMGAMEIATYGLQIGLAGFNGFNAIDPSAGAATASAVEESVRSTNPMQLVYGESDIDLIDAWYVIMSEPMMMVEMENDPFDIVYG